jgi:hypothetical protein
MMIEFLLVVLIVVNIYGAIQNRQILKMIQKIQVVVIVVITETAKAQPPEKQIAAAVADAEKLLPQIAGVTRYFTFANSTISKPEEIKEAADILTFHLWSISHEADPPQLRFVTPTLAAIRLDEFGVDYYVFGRLLFRDPYHHVPLTEDGKKESARAAGFWLGDPAQVSKLIKLTNSQVPILRWDWFFAETSIQEGRGVPGKGTGIYDFYGVAKRDDFFKAVGADPKKAEELKRRWRAIIKESGVAFYPRQVERFDAIGGGYWFTLDVLDQPTGKRNGLRQLDKDFTHQAEEHYGIGPAGLPWYLACAADGTLQNSAPDRVGPDKTRIGNRTTIDVGASCVRCHKEILRPLDNWFHEVVKQPTTAEIPYEKAIETRRLYFRNLQSKLEQDRRVFTDRLLECNKLAPAKNAELYIKWSDRYNESRLDLEDCARELGTATEKLKVVLCAVQQQGKLDPILADLVSVPPGKIRRESWEEVYPIAMTYLGGKP